MSQMHGDDFSGLKSHVASIGAAITSSPELRCKLDEALVALARLDAVPALLPMTSIYAKTIPRAEAMCLSRIEGKTIHIGQLLRFEIDKKASIHKSLANVERAKAIFDSIEFGIREVEAGSPLSLPLLNKLYRKILPHPVSEHENLFRCNALESPDKIQDELNMLLNLDCKHLPVIARAALIFVEFMRMQPYKINNLALGCMLINLTLIEGKLLTNSALCVSYHFWNQGRGFCNVLHNVQRKNDWKGWLAFFVDGLILSAQKSTALMEVAYKHYCQERVDLVNENKSVLTIHAVLPQMPCFTAKMIVAETDLSMATVNDSLRQLEELKIVRETTRNRRNKIFHYKTGMGIYAYGYEFQKNADLRSYEYHEIEMSWCSKYIKSQPRKPTPQRPTRAPI